MELTRNSEFGIRSAEYERVSIPHSAFRIPHCVAVAGLVLFCVLMMPAMAVGCPGCKDALFDPGQLQQKRSTAAGYAFSIGLMLSMPALLVGGATVLLVRAHRRKRAVAYGSGTPVGDHAAVAARCPPRSRDGAAIR